MTHLLMREWSLFSYEISCQYCETQSTLAPPIFLIILIRLYELYGIHYISSTLFSDFFESLFILFNLLLLISLMMKFYINRIGYLTAPNPYKVSSIMINVPFSPNTRRPLSTNPPYLYNFCAA